MNYDENGEPIYDPVYGSDIDEEGNEKQVLAEVNTVEEAPKPKKGIFKIVLGVVLGFVSGAVACALVLVLIFTNTSVGKTAESLVNSATGSTSTTSVSDSKLAYIVALIKQVYYEDVDDDTLLEGIYKGVVESLDDPYSAYYTSDEYDDLLQTLTGDYAGIGALLSKNKETGVVTIAKVYADTPADEAGLKNGDEILYADEYAATDEDLDVFIQHIRGDVGTDVTLTILRDDEEMEFTVTRATVTTPTVEYQMLDNNMGYITISQFGTGTADEFKAAMDDLQAQGMTSVIFDLRNNGGGLLDSVVDILDYLLPEGTTVYTMDKSGNRTDYTSDAENYVSMPMTVLVNGNTASAAEIFTGAIRDFNYGTIIGTTTYGKGVVQSTIPLSDGSALKITTATYYTPSGECIHGSGITPDIELEYEFLGSEEDTYAIEFDNQIQKAIEVLQGETT